MGFDLPVECVAYIAFMSVLSNPDTRAVNTLHKNLSVPVTAKFRVFPTVEKTVEYAKMLERAGAQILTCHGRTREQRGHRSVSTTMSFHPHPSPYNGTQGVADWEKIRAVKEAVSVPVIANGNILFYSDIEKCLAATGADAVMSAEGNLYNPAIFQPGPASSTPGASTSAAAQYLTGSHPRTTHLALEYLAIVKSQKTLTTPSAVKGHLFKLLRPALQVHRDLREQLGRVRVERSERDKDGGSAWDKYEELIRELDARLEVHYSILSYSYRQLTGAGCRLTSKLQRASLWKSSRQSMRRLGSLYSPIGSCNLTFALFLPSRRLRSHQRRVTRAASR